MELSGIGIETVSDSYSYKLLSVTKELYQILDQEK